MRELPSVSQAQQRLFAIAEHAPEKLYKRNAALKGLKKGVLREFAATKRSGLPARAPHHERTRAHYDKKRGME